MMMQAGIARQAGGQPRHLEDSIEVGHVAGVEGRFS